MSLNFRRRAKLEASRNQLIQQDFFRKKLILMVEVNS